MSRRRLAIALTSLRTAARRGWPWLVLGLAFLSAVWHVLDFEQDVDPEYPSVVRQTFSAFPPAAYRLAEPGDTIDRISLYAAAGGLVLSLGALLRKRHRGEPLGLWPSAVGLALIATWHAATPGPCLDGWYGLGWRAILDPRTPAAPRLVLALSAKFLLVLVVSPVLRGWTSRHAWLAAARERGALGLLVVSAVLVLLRQCEVPRLGPPGYWPRWSLALGLIAFDLALVRLRPRLEESRRFRLVGASAGAAGWVGVVAAGLWVTWYHRPIERLDAVVPGRIYISAMPDARGLELFHLRHPFKTMINLFPEETAERSPLLPQEEKFVREHGLRYLRSPSATDMATADAFLDATLAAAQDPSAWPILVHCHACMDRTPAWVGIYRYVVEGKPLDEVFREIERRRGYRPKASVTLLYNHALARLQPGRYEADPVAALLRRNAKDSPGLWSEPTARISRREGVGEASRRP